MASCDGRLTLIPANDLKMENRMDTMRHILLVATLSGALAASGCAGMSDTEQRAGTGAAIGAGGGAIIGAMSGNTMAGAAIGAGAGLVGGLVVDKTKKDQEKSYQEGYEAGQQSH